MGSERNRIAAIVLFAGAAVLVGIGNETVGDSSSGSRSGCSPSASERFSAGATRNALEF